MAAAGSFTKEVRKGSSASENAAPEIIGPLGWHDEGGGLCSPGSLERTLSLVIRPHGQCVLDGGYALGACGNSHGFVDCCLAARSAT